MKDAYVVLLSVLLQLLRLRHGEAEIPRVDAVLDQIPAVSARSLASRQHIYIGYGASWFHPSHGPRGSPAIVLCVGGVDMHRASHAACKTSPMKRAATTCACGPPRPDALRREAVGLAQLQVFRGSPTLAHKGVADGSSSLAVHHNMLGPL